MRFFTQIRGRVDGFVGQRIDARVVHRSGDRHRRGNEVLNLPRAQILLLQVQGQLHGVRERGARVTGDEVRHQVLLFAGRFTGLAKRLREALVHLDARLLHLFQHFRIGVLGRHGDLAAGVVLGQFGDEFRAALGQIITNPRGDEHALDAPFGAHFAEQFDQRIMIGLQVLADPRMHAGEPATRALGALVLAAHLVHVGGRPTHVRDRAAEARHARQLPHLPQHALGGAALNDAPLVLGDAAKGAAAEAAAHGHESIL